jgi:hypothetical protein
LMTMNRSPHLRKRRALPPPNPRRPPRKRKRPPKRHQPSGERRRWYVPLSTSYLCVIPSLIAERLGRGRGDRDRRRRRFGRGVCQAREKDVSCPLRLLLGANEGCNSAAKKAPPKKKAPAASAKQSQLAFAPATGRTSRAAATKARGKMVVRNAVVILRCAHTPTG